MISISLFSPLEIQSKPYAKERVFSPAGTSKPTGKKEKEEKKRQEEGEEERPGSLSLRCGTLARRRNTPSPHTLPTDCQESSAYAAVPLRHGGAAKVQCHGFTDGLNLSFFYTG